MDVNEIIYNRKTNMNIQDIDYEWLIREILKIQNNNRKSMFSGLYDQIRHILNTSDHKAVLSIIAVIYQLSPEIKAKDTEVEVIEKFIERVPTRIHRIGLNAY